MKVITNWNVALLFLLSAGVLVFLRWYGISHLCEREDIYNYTCGEILGYTGYFAYFAVFLFFPSLLTLPFVSAVFDRWKRFAVKAVPVVVVLTLLLTFMDEGGAYFSFGFGAFFLLLIYGWFTLHSLALIVYAALKERKRATRP